MTHEVYGTRPDRASGRTLPAVEGALDLRQRQAEDERPPVRAGGRAPRAEQVVEQALHGFAVSPWWI